MARPRILIAEDHTLVVEGFRRILEPRFDVVGTAEDGRAALEAVSTLKPDIVLMDISLPLVNGIDATRRIAEASPRTKVIIVSMHADSTYVREAMRVGASGYLLKRSAASELATAIEEVLAGRTYVTPLLLGIAAAAPSGELTARQREVLQLIAEGNSAKEIGYLLGLSSKTVEFHKAKIMRQLGLNNNADLIRYALAHGLVTQ